MMGDGSNNERTAFFGSLPRHGVWSAVHLSFGQFAMILVVSMGIFVFLDGALWLHLQDSHFVRITVSYAFIPVAVLGALVYNRQPSLTAFVGGTFIIGLAKLLLTALLVMLLGLFSR
jgi:hypothetical protein